MYNNLLKPLSLLFLSLFLVTACGDKGGDPDPNNPGNPQSPKDEEKNDEGPEPTKTPTLDKIKQLHTALQDAALKGEFEKLWQYVVAQWEKGDYSTPSSSSPFEDGSITPENQEVFDVFTQLSPAVDQLAAQSASDFDTEAKAIQALEALTKKLTIGAASTPLSLPVIKKAAEQLKKLAHVDNSDTTQVLKNVYVFVSQEDVKTNVPGADSYAGDGNGTGWDINKQGDNQITFAEAQLLCRFAQALIALAS